MRSAVRKIMKMCMRAACRGIFCICGKRTCPQTPKRILLVAGGYLGDTFWALQVIPILKDIYPEAEIHVAGRPFLHELANTLVPDERLHEVLIVSDRTRETFDGAALKRAAMEIRDSVRPDLVIDLMFNRYSAWFCFRMKAYCIGMDLAEETAPLYSFCAKKALVPSVHLAYRPRSLVRQFSGQPDSADMTLIPPVPKKTKDELLAQYGLGKDEKTVLLVPGAGWQAKQWQPENFRKLAKDLAEKGHRILVSGSAGERELCRSVAEGVPGAVVLCGVLADTISFLPHCSAVVGNDSGVIHLAESFNIRTVSLYCATNPAFSRGLTDRSVCLAARCPYSPPENEQYCRERAVVCRRPERMALSVEQVEKCIEEAGNA